LLDVKLDIETALPKVNWPNSHSFPEESSVLIFVLDVLPDPHPTISTEVESETLYCPMTC
jgi:hypothetical protein